ncbi:MAG TPA: BlaI/MecI/CopY family transcriptional regulator [Pseudonocardiaceae bacterium]
MGPRRAHRRAAGELENEILAALWAAGRPLAPKEVQQSLGRPLAYNTVQTILVRLHDKGLVERSTHGRTHHYQPTKGPEELAAERMRLLLARGSDRRTVLRQFVQGLDAHDEQILRDVLGGAL